MKQEGNLSQRVEHHQIKYRNNRLESDHGKLKRLINPARVQSMKTAYATIKGFEVMRMFKKGQFNIWMVVMKCHLLTSCFICMAKLRPDFVFL